MRHLLAVLLFLGLTASAAAQTSNTTTITLADEGVTQGRIRTMDCTGSGITCTVSGFTGTVAVTGGSGSANVVEISANLGVTGGSAFSATITGQSWVTSTSVIVCSPFATAADGQTVETYVAAQFTVSAASRVVSTGFDIWIFSPHGATGTFRFDCTGA